MSNATNQDKQQADKLNVVLNAAALEAYEREQQTIKGFDQVLAVADSSLEGDIGKERLSTPWMQPEVGQRNPSHGNANMRVADMSPADLKVYISQTVFEAMDAWMAQQSPEPEPEYIQEDEPDLASLMADMSAEDIKAVFEQFLEESQQQDQGQALDGAANDNSQPLPEGGDDPEPDPPSSLQQYLADYWQQHSHEENDRQQQRAITY